MLVIASRLKEKGKTLYLYLTWKWRLIKINSKSLKLNWIKHR